MSDNIEKQPPVPPFVRFVASAVPMVFDNSLSYYEAICAMWKYLNDTVSVINNNATVTESYIALTQEMKQYMDNYFDNLDVQEEINNKLDAMVTDGTLGSIVEPYLETFEAEIRGDITALEGAVGDKTKLTTTLKTDLVNAINSANENYISLMREKYGRDYRYFSLPLNDSWFSNVKVLKDTKNNNFNYYFDESKFIQSGGSTYYVDPTTTEASSTQTGAADHPYKFLAWVWKYNTVADGDTIILKPAIYWRNYCNINYQVTGGTERVNKSINIIAEDGVYLTYAEELTWAVDSTFSNIYVAARSNVSNVIDIRQRDKGIYNQLTKVSSASECAGTPFSWFNDSTNVYVNLDGDVVSNSSIVCNLKVTPAAIPIEDGASPVTVYLKKLNCLGGSMGIVSITGTQSTGHLRVVACDCKFYYNTKEDSNAITVRGADTIFKNCEACFAMRDGFNYHANSSILCNSIELDCLGAYNGHDNNYNNNGSTTHDGNKVLRIKGVYFNNKGPNVADVSDNTISVNLDCIAFDSEAILTQKNDFMTTDTVTMYLYNCYTRGSRSINNIRCAGESSVLHLNDNTLYDTLDNAGTTVVDSL